MGRMIARALRIAIVLLSTSAPALAQGTSENGRVRDPMVREIGPIGMTVSDLDSAVQFYTTVLDFQKMEEHELVGEDWEHLQGVFGLRIRVATLRLGDELLELTEYLAPRGRPIPPDMRSNDHAFQHVAIIVSDMDAVYQRLRQHRVQHASTGPQTLPDWNPNAGGIEAFYFRDPDGHTLEVLAFPAGKGDARWQRKDALFLGIDHTAVVVGDTDRSIGFYRDVLGLSVAGAAENWGTEQEHLNNVFGARLRITSLRAARGPAIELLEYLAPGDGRPYPPDSKANDLWHWQTHLVSSDAEAAARTLFEQRLQLISPGAVVLKSREPGFSRGLLVRDPDGHAMAIIER
jgi:catechol 2,3-dioxygenase-like lactoylglutathione lyase family enzyme